LENNKVIDHQTYRLKMFEQTRSKARILSQYLELPPEQQTVVESILNDIVFPSFGRDHFYPRWQSYITDDFSPIEFSVSFAPKGAKLRLIFEPLGTEDPIDLTKLRDASASTLELLRKRWPYELNLTQFNAVKTLFFIDEPRGKLVCWYGVDFGAAPIIKVYFNPQIQKPEKSALQVGEEFMERLNHGQHEGWLRLRDYLAEHPDTTEIEALSTDLIAPERARIKVHIAQRLIVAERELI
jgi:DMATS type aromatic prenyltransferase